MLFIHTMNIWGTATECISQDRGFAKCFYENVASSCLDNIVKIPCQNQRKEAMTTVLVVRVEGVAKCKTTQSE